MDELDEPQVTITWWSSAKGAPVVSRDRLELHQHRDGRVDAWLVRDRRVAFVVALRSDPTKLRP